MKNKAFTLIELLITFAIIAILGSMTVTVVGGHGGGCSTSDGKRVGILQKFSLKQTIPMIGTRTYEGQLQLGGVSGGAANVWDFSVIDPEVVKQMDPLMGKRVICSYDQVFGYSCQRKTSYVVKAIALSP